MAQLLLAVIYVSFISIGLPDSLLGSAWPSMYGGLGVPVSYAGLVSMLIAGCTILSSLLSDRLVRRLGTGAVTALSVGMTALALFGFSVSHSFPALCLWAVPYGLGAGSVDAALNNFIALHYKAKHMNWLHCFWGVGATLGPYVMGACLTGGAGWGGGYRAVSLLQAALTAVLVFSLPLWKRQDGWRKSAAPPQRSKRLFALPGAKQVLLALFCYGSLEQISGLWGSSYLVLVKNLSPESAASLISLFYLGITAGRFLSGFLAVKLPPKSLIQLGQGAVLAGVALLFLSGGPVGAGCGLALVGAGCAPIYPNLLHQTPERFGAEASQSMMGLQMACAYVGTTFSPLLAGLLSQIWGVALYPLFQLVFLAAMLLAVESANHRPSGAALRGGAGE